MRETGNIFSGDEYHFRLGIFLSNKRYVEQHNAAGKSFKVALNHLAHLTPNEYKVLLGEKPYTGERKYVKLDNVAAASVDWRTKGIVNEIKDQGQCGSCWAFSAIQACESRWAQAGHKLLSFSEQNLVDCCGGCYGCDGGWSAVAIAFVTHTQDGYFMLESDYPYTAQDGQCKFDKMKGVGNTKGADGVEPTEEALAKAVTNGVVTISIDASQHSFHLYSSGIYYEPACSSTFLDHAVGCVGYGTEGSQAYWIVRNSWGTTWGEKGYIRMIKDKDNNCGVATRVELPIAL